MKKDGQLFGSVSLAPNLLTQAIDAMKTEKGKPWSKYLETHDLGFDDLGPDPMKAMTAILNKTGFSVDMMDIVKPYSECPTKDSILSIFALCC